MSSTVPAKSLTGLKVEGDLRREISLNIKRLQEIGSYRGLSPVVAQFVVKTPRTTLVHVKDLSNGHW